MRFLVLILPLGFIGVIYSVFAANPTLDKADKPKVILQEIKTIEDKKRIIVPVKVESKIQSVVNADIEGHVTKILKPLGSAVKAGEVVLYLENKDPGFTYAAVPVRSPVTGVISQFMTSHMAKANRGDRLFTVINPKNLKLSAEFPSSDLSYVHSGLNGELKIDSLKDSNFAIRVVGLSPLIDSRTGTASAELEFTQLKKNLPPIGSIGQAVFEIQQGQILMVPESALFYQEGKPLVRILKGKDQFAKKNLELGEQRDSSYVVKSGIANGDKIIVRSSRSLKEGEVIEIEPSASETVK